MRANKLGNKIANIVAVGKNKVEITEQPEKSKSQEKRVKISKEEKVLKLGKKKDKKNVDS